MGPQLLRGRSRWLLIELSIEWKRIIILSPEILTSSDLALAHEVPTTVCLALENRLLIYLKIIRIRTARMIVPVIPMPQDRLLVETK